MKELVVTLAGARAGRLVQKNNGNHIQQLHKRRCDLLDTNLDLLTDIGADNDLNALIMGDIHANRRSVEALDKVFDAYSDKITT